MRHTSVVSLMLLLTSMPVVAQTPAPDSQIAQAVLLELRQLRNDLQEMRSKLHGPAAQVMIGQEDLCVSVSPCFWRACLFSRKLCRKRGRNSSLRGRKH
jgi:hypothetical protein